MGNRFDVVDGGSDYFRIRTFPFLRVILRPLAAAIVKKMMLISTAELSIFKSVLNLFLFTSLFSPMFE